MKKELSLIDRASQIYEESLWWIAERPTIINVLAELIMVAGGISLFEALRSGTFLNTDFDG